MIKLRIYMKRDINTYFYGIMLMKYVYKLYMCMFVWSCVYLYYMCTHLCTHVCVDVCVCMEENTRMRKSVFPKSDHSGCLGGLHRYSFWVEMFIFPAIRNFNLFPHNTALYLQDSYPILGALLEDSMHSKRREFRGLKTLPPWLRTIAFRTILRGHY